MFQYIFGGGKISVKNFVTVAFPGIVFVFWYLYVTIKFHAFPFSQADGITQLFLTAWPSFFLSAIQNDAICEILGLLLYFIVIVTGLILSMIAGKRDKVFWAVTPYVFLIGSFGPTVMANYAGYLKGSSVLFFLIPVMFFSMKDKIYDAKKNKKLKYLIAALLVFSFLVSALCINNKIVNTSISQDLNQIDKTAVADEVKPLEDYAAELNIINYDYKAKCNIPMASVFVKDYAICEMKIKNLSTSAWQNIMQSNGAGLLAISYRWYKESDIAFEQCILEGNRTAVGKDVKPGESIDRKMYVEYPKEQGNYILRVSLIQEGYAWFDQYNTGYADISVAVH